MNALACLRSHRVGRRAVLGLVLLLSVVQLQTGCARAPRFVYEQRPQAVPNAELIAVPHVDQFNGRACGAAALEMVLAHWGTPLKQQQIAEEVDKGEPAGLSAGEMKSFVERHGYRAFLVHGTPNDLFQYLGKGIPLIVARRAQFSNGPGNHYMVAVGYSRDHEHVYVNDPDLGRLRVSLADFLNSWSAAQRFLMVVVPQDRIAPARAAALQGKTAPAAASRNDRREAGFKRS